MTALARVFPTSTAPTCCYVDCHQADVHDDLCSAHGVDCKDCGVRFDPWDVQSGKCIDCRPIDLEMVDYVDLLAEPMAAKEAR